MPAGTTAGGGGGAWTVIETITSTGLGGNAVFSGLDLDTDGFYKVYLFGRNESGAGVAPVWHANDDTTAGNYRANRIENDGGATLWQASSNTNNIGTFANLGLAHLEFSLSKASGHEPQGFATIHDGTMGTIEYRIYGIAWNSTANVTKLTFADFHDLVSGSKIVLMKISQ